MNSEIKQILIYIKNGETERLKQKEWVDIANKLLGKEKGQNTMYDPNWKK